MTDGFEAAKARRNWLERLGEKIPGFRGYQDRELRRDVDRLQREHLAGEIGRLKGAAREKARAYTDAGRIGSLAGFERLDRQLDGLAQSVRFADYGASGLFDAVKIGEAELARLYELDLALLDEIAELERAIAAVPAVSSSAETSPDAALGAAVERARAVAERWSRREQVMSDVVRTG